MRSAEQKFLGCWVAKEVLIGPGVDRVATDITDGSHNPAELGDEYIGGDYLT